MLSNSNPTTNRFRVLLVTEAALPSLCGVSRIADEITKRLNHCELRVLGPDYAHPHSNGAALMAVPTLTIPIYTSFKVVIPYRPRIYKQIRSYLEEFRPSVILTIGSGFLAGMAGHIARTMNIPVVGLNDTDFLTYANHYRISAFTTVIKAFMRWVHSANVVTLVSSPSYSEKLQQIGFSNIKLWNFGIDTSRFAPGHRSEALRQKIISVYPDTRLICLSVSRLAVEKSIDKLLPIARLEGVTLVIVGDGPDRDRLEKIFAGTRTLFWGALFGEELSQIYASADVFLTASYSETFGLTVLEALASGIPSIVMDANGVRDTVVHQETGFICQSIEDMLHYTRLFRDRADIRLQMGERALKRRADYSWDASIKHLNKILLETAQVSKQQYSNILQSA